MTGVLGTADLMAWAAPRARVEPTRIAPGGRARVAVRLEIPQGCHIQAHEPADPFLVPTVLTLDGHEGLEVHEIRYPVHEIHRFDWSPVVLAVYRGDVEIFATVEATAVVRRGRHHVAGRIRYQGCTENTCLPPAERAFDVTLDIE